MMVEQIIIMLVNGDHQIIIIQKNGYKLIKHLFLMILLTYVINQYINN